MLTHFVKVSSNAKTGAIPVTTTGFQSCPDNCGLKSNGCYASGGHVAMHWRKVTEGKRGDEFSVVLDKIKALPKGQLWRHNQAGDLYGENNAIDTEALAQLVQANKGKKGFTYTHKPVLDNAQNAEAIKQANRGGFTINLSADNLEQADALMDLEIAPVVTILPEGTPKVSYTRKGRRVIVCPAQQVESITCATCGLCQKQGVGRGNASDRRAIIGFIVHGASKKKAQKVFMMQQA